MHLLRCMTVYVTALLITVVEAGMAVENVAMVINLSWFDELMVSAIVIDDDRDTVDVFVDYLEILNVTIWGVGYDGKRAVELYDNHRPDIVFLDLMMPEYDGFYALEKIREINPDAKVVVITADLRGDTEERLDMLKPTEIIYKPFNPEMLKRMIEKFV